ncbi:MAG: PP2C family protein-serine/threonine phosphatase [candidate division KSB1 bacterium]|nr:PP2C family protein-serine/threonine phosphatase [candidate division KSB1 bacterium]MDZ7302754.1 PP2C family protein-serine/threonine phosphatase [candidate division KSB1 bacterium]MDZ7310078.1 PP2C family protein-serine/threonine phosphatase [candidate division KSB1 bacterium]
MITPKNFYRKLDALISKIGKEKASKHYFATIVAELEEAFGEDLHIANGRLYKESGNAFVLFSPPAKTKTSNIAARLPMDSEPIKRLLQNGSYIYDDPSLSIDPHISMQEEYAIPAAFTVRTKSKRWIFVFELKSGWVREEVEFCFNAVRTALNHRLFSDSVKNEFEQAAKIQYSLLPASAPQIRGYQIAGRSEPAELVVGDFYDYFEFDDEMFGVSIGDASGHGILAAMLVRDVVTGMRMGLGTETKMVPTIKKLNRILHRSTYSTRFVTLFYAEIESNGNIIYVNAGHPAPLLVSGERIEELSANGTILGALAEIDLQRSIAYFEPNAILVMYSDGIFERTNREGEQFGISRLKKLIVRNQRKSAQEIMDLIFDTVFQFGHNARWEDDATVVVIKRVNEKTKT